MGKVIAFTGITRLDLAPDSILKQALGKYEAVVLLGYTEAGDEYFATNLADGGTVLWLLERCKIELLSVCNEL